MLDSRPQGAAYRKLNGQPFVQPVTLAELMFDGKPLWDKKVLNFTLNYQFEKLVNQKTLSAEYNMEFSSHMIVPWIERYIEEATRLNGMNRLEPVKMEECVERAQKAMLTPNQAEIKLARPTVQSPKNINAPNIR